MIRWVELYEPVLCNDTVDWRKHANFWGELEEEYSRIIGATVGSCGAAGGAGAGWWWWSRRWRGGFLPDLILCGCVSGLGGGKGRIGEGAVCVLVVFRR